MTFSYVVLDASGVTVTRQTVTLPRMDAGKVFDHVLTTLPALGHSRGVFKYLVYDAAAKQVGAPNEFRLEEFTA